MQVTEWAKQKLGYVHTVHNGGYTSAGASSNYGSPQLNYNGRAECAFVILRLALSLRANRDVVARRLSMIARWAYSAANL